MMDDELAALYILRLWAHCEVKRQWIFDDLKPVRLKAICQYRGNAEILWDAFVEAPWIDEVEDGWEVHGWAEQNKRLTVNWELGKRLKKKKSSGSPLGSTKANPRLSLEEHLGQAEVKPRLNLGQAEGDTEAKPRLVLGQADTPPDIDIDYISPIVPFEKGEYSRLSRTDKKQRKVSRNTELMDRILKFVSGPKASRLWSLAEWEALENCGGEKAADWGLLERFYVAGGRGYLIPRKDVATLLNHLGGEEDKARKWEAGEGDRDGKSGNSEDEFSRMELK